jgi:hypothetical protein
VKIQIELDLDEATWSEDYARRNGRISMPDDVIDSLVDALNDWARPADLKTMISIPLT